MDCDATDCTENYNMEDVSLFIPPLLLGRGLTEYSFCEIYSYIHTPVMRLIKKCDSSKAFIAFPSELKLVILVYVKWSSLKLMS